MEPVSMAIQLAEWAQSARDALRKIIEEFNALFADTHGRLGHVDASFVASCLRTEIESLAKSGCGSRDWLLDALDCPICLNTVFRPVAPAACGHALCRACFEALGGCNAVCP
eukprot:308128-Prymnesium_polylepis.1